MRIPFLSSKEERHDVVAVFDVTDASVAGGIVALAQESGTPSRVLLAKRQTLPPQKTHEAQTLSHIQKALFGVADALVAEYAKGESLRSYGAVQAVHVIVHAPWVHSFTQDTQIAFEKPTKITKELINQAVQEIAAHREGGQEPEGEIIENSVLRVELSGYPTSQPIGKEATSIRAVAIESRVSGAVRASISDALARVFPGTIALMHSSLLVHHSVLRELVPDMLQYTFLDMGDGSSTCCVVHDGTVQEQSEIVFGSGEFVRAVAGAISQPDASAYSAIAMAAEDTSGENLRKRVDDALGAIEPKYVRTFGEAFTSLIGAERLPNTLVVSIHPKLAKWAVGFFERIDFSQFTETGKPFSVQIITTKNTTDFAIFGTLAKADKSIGVAAAFVHIRYS